LPKLLSEGFNFLEFGALVQVFIYVDKGTTLDSFTAYSVHFPMFLIFSKVDSVAFTVSNVRMGRFHLHPNDRADVRDGGAMDRVHVVERLSAPQGSSINHTYRVVVTEGTRPRVALDHRRIVIDNHLARCLTFHHCYY
jgi:hypothetical protein